MCGLVLAAACSSEPAVSPATESSAEASEDEVPEHPSVAALAALREQEEAMLGRPRSTTPWSQRSGPDPISIVSVGVDRYVGLLRGASALVLLDGQGHEFERVEAPAGAIGWARDGEAFVVVGERSNEATWFEVRGDGLEVARRMQMQGVGSPRAVALGDAGRLFVADRYRGSVLSVDASGRTHEVTACPGAIDVQREGDLLFVNCLLAHRVIVLPLNEAGVPQAEAQLTIEHDGPIWSMAARREASGVTLALGGVEDHPLERKGGGFGYIDSFVFIVRIGVDEDGRRRAQRTAAINVSEHGVVTPKWLQWRDEALLVSGAGSDVLATVRFKDDSPHVEVRDTAVGLVAVAGELDEGLAASPLLDRWIRLRPGGWEPLPIEGTDARSEQVRVGEALALTTLLAPQGRSEGKASRFTCETCHFEGTVDGRTHHTGRGDVHATTKTLRGLVGNRPHFSRALDRTTTDMVHNEFRVANHGTDFDPWFSLRPADNQWLALLSTSPLLTPAQLRTSLLHFLAAYTPEPNPARRGFTQLDARQQHGAKLFEQYCERCHAARIQADDPDSRVPPQRWADHILGDGDVLWGASPRALVDIEPRVHPRGPRTPSLRRLWTKRPYFTNGSAEDLGVLLEGVRLGEPFSHGGRGARPLDPDEQDALLAFVQLL